MARIWTALACLGTAVTLVACGSTSSSGEPPNSMRPPPPTMGAPPAATTTSAAASDRQPAGVLNGTLTSLNGSPENLAKYRGKVVLVVNTATECGFTPQFDGLEKLYREKRDQGFVILGFPADDVAHQEPRGDAAIAQFCRANFGVSFPMFAKSNVVDAPVNPVFAKLDARLGPPTWNFNKYLLDRSGRPVAHFHETTEPDDPALTSRIDQLLRS